MYVANYLEGVKTIICMTETRFTHLLISRITSSLPIYAVAEKRGTCEITARYKGVIPVPFDTYNLDPSASNHYAVEKLREHAEVVDDDLLITTKGARHRLYQRYPSCGLSREKFKVTITVLQAAHQFSNR